MRIRRGKGGQDKMAWNRLDVLFEIYSSTP